MKTQRIYLVSFLAVTGMAAACGGKGDESGGGDGDVVGVGGYVVAGDGDGDVVGDGDLPTGGAQGTGGVLGAGGVVMGGDPMGTGGDLGAGGVPSVEGGCSGSPLACEEQSDAACIMAGCTMAPVCSGDAGCEEFETPMLCNRAADDLECHYGPACSGTPGACADHADSVSCESVGCTWAEN